MSSEIWRRITSHPNEFGSIWVYPSSDNKWSVNFTYALCFLRDIYDGPWYFDSADECMKHIDEWLIRIDELMAFV